MKTKLIGFLCAVSMAFSPLCGTQVLAGAVTIITEESLPEVQDLNNVTPGSNMNNAALVPLNTRVRGTHQANAEEWLAFTTSPTPDLSYVISVVNKTPQSEDLTVDVYDDKGNKVFSFNSSSNGNFNSNYDTLAPDSTYYVKINSRYNYDNPIQYLFLVRQAVSTNSVSVPEDGNSLVNPQDSNINLATNADDASYLPLGTKIQASLEDGSYHWFAFTTDASPETTYAVSAVNMSPGSEDLVVGIYDSYGINLAEKNVGNNGIAASASVDLLPGTTYYVCLKNRYANDGNNTDYSLIVQHN